MFNIRSKVLRLIARCFYSREWVNFDYLSPNHLITMGIMQRIVGFNRRVPWPVHHSSVIQGWNKIKLKTLPPYVGAGTGQYIQCINGIEIGEYVRLGPGVKLISSDHDLSDFQKHIESPPIIIGDYCWLAANVVLLPGVQLGSHVVVAAGSVVTKSFPEDNVILAGIPAKIVKHLPAYEGSIPDSTIYIKERSEDV